MICRAPPPGLEVLVDEDGAMVMSFPLPASASKLSPAECAILVELLAGRSNVEIASLRGARPRTVANQVARVFEKLGVGSRLELLARVPVG